MLFNIELFEGGATCEFPSDPSSQEEVERTFSSTYFSGERYKFSYKCPDQDQTGIRERTCLTTGHCSGHDIIFGANDLQSKFIFIIYQKIFALFCLLLSSKLIPPNGVARKKIVIANCLSETFELVSQEV